MDAKFKMDYNINHQTWLLTLNSFNNLYPLSIKKLNSHKTKDDYFTIPLKRRKMKKEKRKKLKLAKTNSYIYLSI
jgi:hypothetical protein